MFVVHCFHCCLIFEVYVHYLPSVHVYGNGKQQLQAVAVAGADGLNLYDSCSAAYERI